MKKIIIDYITFTLDFVINEDQKTMDSVITASIGDISLILPVYTQLHRGIEHRYSIYTKGKDEDIENHRLYHDDFK